MYWCSFFVAVALSSSLAGVSDFSHHRIDSVKGGAERNHDLISASRYSRVAATLHTGHHRHSLPGTELVSSPLPTMASASASKGKAPGTAKFIDAEGYEMPW